MHTTIMAKMTKVNDELTDLQFNSRCLLLTAFWPTWRALGGRQHAQHPCFLFGAKEVGAGAEYRGIKQRFPYQCNETKTSRTARRRSPWSPRRRHHQSLLQAKTAFVRISRTSCPLSNWPLLAPFPLNIWGEDQGLYK